MRSVSIPVTAMLLLGGIAIGHAEPGFPPASLVAEQRSVTLPPVVFPPRGSAVEQTQTVTGSLARGARDWVYLPVDVPSGVREIDVSYSYDRPAVAPGERGNALDIGIFDESGIGLGNARGFRGWSGGARTSFSISASDATPGYLPGPVHAGRWHIIFGPYGVAPQGLNWSVTVTLQYGAPGAAFVPNFAPESAPGRGRAWYRGDMHLHTVYSDGHRLPQEVADGARAAGLDFMVSTEHNTTSAHAIWGNFATPDLLIINGEEVTTRNGHYLALGLPRDRWIDWRYRATDDAFSGFTHEIHAAGALAVAAHPFSPCVACNWKFGYGDVDAIEVWNGPWTLDDEAVLASWDSMLVANARSRTWIPAVGDSDAHSVPQVIGLPQNVVLADRLERGAVMDGVRRGHTWIAESNAVNLTFSAASGNRSAGIGDRLEVGDTDLVSVQLDVSGAPGGVVRFISDEGDVLDTVLPAGGTGTVTWTTKPQISRFVRAEVRHPSSDPSIPGAMIAFTNPIFLGR